MRPERHPLIGFLLLLLLLAGCATDGPPRTGSVILRKLPPDPVPREEPRSRHGNGPIYNVLGKNYRVMDTSYGYKERGVASWYGKKFHGRQTSNSERYDMYAMTAAHKSLPLPTYVRVTNLRNNKSVIVRVNDRGPFVHNRIIDLSYSAARKLDMIKTGTSLVEVTAISFDEPPRRPVIASRPTKRQAEETTANEPTGGESTVYVQVGAFGDAENARRRFTLLRNGGIGNAFVLEDSSSDPTVFRIRIGPITDTLQYDTLVAKLQNLGIAESHLVTE